MLARELLAVAEPAVKEIQVATSLMEVGVAQAAAAQVHLASTGAIPCIQIQISQVAVETAWHIPSVELLLTMPEVAVVEVGMPKAGLEV